MNARRANYLVFPARWFLQGPPHCSGPPEQARSTKLLGFFSFSLICPAPPWPERDLRKAKTAQIKVKRAGARGRLSPRELRRFRAFLVTHCDPVVLARGVVPRTRMNLICGRAPNMVFVAGVGLNQGPKSTEIQFRWKAVLFCARRSPSSTIQIGFVRCLPPGLKYIPPPFTLPPINFSFFKLPMAPEKKNKNLTFAVFCHRLGRRGFSFSLESPLTDRLWDFCPSPRKLIPSGASFAGVETQPYFTFTPVQRLRQKPIAASNSLSLSLSK